MEINTQTKLLFNGVRFFNVHFDASKARSKDDKLDIEVKCEPKVFYPKDSPHTFNVIFDLTVIGKDYFDLNLRAIGDFELNEEIDKKIKEIFINTNAPAIMFPYIRSFVTTLTSNLGNVIGPIILPPHFFKGNVEEFTPDSE